MGVHGYEEHSFLERNCKIKVPMVWPATAWGVTVQPQVRFAPSDTECTLLSPASAHCLDLATTSSFLPMLSCIQFPSDPLATSPELFQGIRHLLRPS